MTFTIVSVPVPALTFGRNRRHAKQRDRLQRVLNEHAEDGFEPILITYDRDPYSEFPWTNFQYREPDLIVILRKKGVV